MLKQNKNKTKNPSDLRQWKIVTSERWQRGDCPAGYLESLQATAYRGELKWGAADTQIELAELRGEGDQAAKVRKSQY
jgi:hypothetical protein